MPPILEKKISDNIKVATKQRGSSNPVMTQIQKAYKYQWPVSASHIQES